MIEFVVASAVMLAVVLLLENKHNREHAALAQALEHANNKSNLYLWALLDTIHVVESEYGTDFPGFEQLRESIHILENPELLNEYQEEMRRNYDA